MPKKEYRFNPDTLSYEVVKEPFRYRFYRVLRKGIFIFIIVSVLNIVYSSKYYTPKIKRLLRENDELFANYDILNNKIRLASIKLEDIQRRDNNVYRPLFAADTVSIDGIYTPFPAERYANMVDNEYGDIMIKNWQELDAVSRQLYRQSLSLDELQELSKDKEHMALAIPAIWPIDKRDLRKAIGAFGNRFHPIYHRYITHKGIDMGAKIGDGIYATANGTIKLTDKGVPKRGYGMQVLIEHGYGYRTRYAHMSEILVVPGQKVKRGELIGRVGNTGGSTGPHLHYEVIYMNKHVDPVNYFRRDMSEAEFEHIIESAKTTTFETDF